MTTIVNKTLGIFATALLIGIIGAHAATLTVDNTGDNGAGTFRQALIDANFNAEANDIVFSIPITDPGYDSGMNRFTILLASELPSIPLAATNITNGPAHAVTVMGDGTFRILTLVNSAVVVMTNVTISSGQSGSPGVLKQKALRSRTQTAGGVGYGFGGGIYMGDSGTLTLNGCAITDNHATSLGGGIYMNNSATLNLHRTTVSGNSGSDGGAIFINNSGTLNIDTSTLSGNSAASGDGGAIYNGTSGTINAVNNTFDSNTAAGTGGAIFNTATLTLTSSTVSSNAADNAGGLYNGATAVLTSNIVALNSATSSGNDVIGMGSWGIAYSGTYNLIGDADFSEGLTAATNLYGTTLAPLNPMLGPLQNNGGSTLTRALLNGSPAIDQGDSPGITTDGRGRPRPFDNQLVTNAADGSDIGAFENILGTSAANVSMNGRVVDAATGGSAGIPNALVTISDSHGSTLTIRSNSFGYFTRTNLPIGTYVVTVSRRGYRFEPQIVNLVDDLAGITFSSIN